MNSVKELRNKLEQQKGNRNQIRKDIARLKTELRDKKRDLINHEQALVIVQKVGMETQQQLQFHISDIVSLALASIFQDPYKMDVQFVQKRGKTECNLMFKRNDKLVKPRDAAGGGTVDVAAFALRIASWSMSLAKSRNTLIFDEPFRFLSKNYHIEVSQLLKELSEKLGVQFIIITQEEPLTYNADAVFKVTQKGNVSRIRKL